MGRVKTAKKVGVWTSAIVSILSLFGIPAPMFVPIINIITEAVISTDDSEIDTYKEDESLEDLFNYEGEDD